MTMSSTTFCKSNTSFARRDQSMVGLARTGAMAAPITAGVRTPCCE